MNKHWQAQFFNREDGELVTYQKELYGCNKTYAQRQFKAMAIEYGWRLVQFYPL